MSMPLGLLLNLDINNTLGALFVGGIFVAIFFGITSAQAFTYFKRNPKDKLLYKVAVAILWTIDALHLSFIAHAGYHYAVTNYMKPTALLVVSWSLIGQIVLTTTSDAIVRSIFAHRVWLLSGGNIFLIVLIVFASCAVFAGGMLFAVRAAQVREFARLVEFSWILYFSLGALTVADIIISASLCVLLRKQGSMAFSRTQSIVRSLMLYSINGSALTSLCAVVCLVTYATMSTNFIFEAFYFVLPKLYLNSLLATLNARESLRQTLTSTDLVSIPLSKTQTSNVVPPSPISPIKRSSRNGVDAFSGVREDRPAVLNIHVETTTDRKSDRDSVRFDPDTPTSHKSARRFSQPGTWSAF
ncbi:hypothetical protein BXZ70DRAFT_1009439 [Cristinia sonorae]|uniref:DUF6534 domain-containing protein n=1 Tax=Cristinia sonorae TaxID=1940300 RepID=A0A8K0UML7_9AGAR|nr:hypothetical protein BXZ70DRAFT_1009439 [Cristinia sonorae]